MPTGSGDGKESIRGSMCEGLRLTRAANVGSPKPKSLAIADTVMPHFARVPQLEYL